MDTFARMTYVFSLNMYFLLIIFSSYAHTSDASNANITCDINQFNCGNSCITLSWKCDGTPDCHGGSDEKDCPPTTCSDNFFRCDDGQCIPDRWKCDGAADCKDESDESSHCPTFIATKCEHDEYHCKNTSQCIASGWVCDGSPDCKHKDDENPNTCSMGCDKSEFQCENKQCISIQWRCDNSNDCADGSDELNCTEKSDCDAEAEMTCNNGECITSSWWCDGDVDCNDKSDEANCTAKTINECSPTEFQCHMPSIDIQCIHMAWMCDGEPDCEDSSDEVNCTDRSCSAEEFKCSDSLCVSLSYHCDGEADCKDGSDEKDCRKEVPCPLNQFACHNGTCIRLEELCDGASQCMESEDESPTLCSSDPCKEDNGMCMQICVPNQSGKGRTCQCNPGYELQHDSETACQDVNECEIPGTCSHKCNNTKGSYICDCESDYVLVNRTFCKAKGDKQAELILSDRHALRRLHLDTFQFKKIFDIHLAMAMDFNIRENQLYWSDIKTKSVYMAYLNSTAEAIPIIHNLSMPDGLAVDWVHGNLYISDTGLNTIEVSRLDGSHRKTLIHTDLDEPRAIVLDPQNGWMYWTDWGNRAKIEKCGMNGQKRKAIVTKNVAWPNGLTIDYIQKRLYWVDAKLHIIASSSLDGTEFKIILKGQHHVGHPFSVTTFEDHLYWTDWKSNAVKKFNKFGKGNVTHVLLDLNQPTDIHVYHSLRQPYAVSPCGDNNGNCSHLCLPRPSGESKKFECACPDGMMFGTGDQQHQCVPTEETTTKKPVMYQPTNNPENRILDKLVETTTQKTKDVPQLSTETTIGVEVFNESKSADTKSEESAGVVALIVIVVLLCLGVSVIVVVFILVRRYKKRNIKSMNFDNPVYRKTTTEDQLIMNKSDSRHNIPSSLQPLTQDSEYVV